MLYKYCANMVQILWKYYINIVQILYKYCANIVHILCKYFLNILHIMCKDFTKIVQILYKYYANIAQIFCKYCTNILQKCLSANMIAQWHTRHTRAKCHLPTHPICENTIHWAAYAAKNGKTNRSDKSKVNYITMM